MNPKLQSSVGTDGVHCLAPIVSVPRIFDLLIPETPFTHPRIGPEIQVTSYVWVIVAEITHAKYYKQGQQDQSSYEQIGHLVNIADIFDAPLAQTQIYWIISRTIWIVNSKDKQSLYFRNGPKAVIRYSKSSVGFVPEAAVSL